MSIGDDGRQLGGILAAGFAGLVIEAFGGGHLPAVIAESAALAELLRRVPVVLASRTGSGEVLRRTYGDTPGSESVLLARGVLSAGDLDGPKARVLLTLLLARGLSAAEIAPFFEHSGALAVSDELSLTHD
jgi:L-asparaginase